MIKAPYNFVPLAQTVVFPDWAEKISMDIPFKDGISGTIDVSYKAQTPVFIGNGNEKDEKGKDTQIVKNYKAANGQYALPGSSLRGMLRNVIEIASFGKFCRIDDSILSVRDLTRYNLYGKYLTIDHGGKNYEARAKAGWLCNESGGWFLYPVEYHRVEDSILEEIYNPREFYDAFFKNKKGPKVESYEDRCEPQLRRKSLNKNPVVYFSLDRETVHEHHGGMKLWYSKASVVRKNSFPSSTKGYTVLTGQPGRRENWKTHRKEGKHMDFIFEEKTSKKILMDKEIIRAFQDANPPNSANQQKGLDINKELKDFQNNNYPGIPVFYLSDSNEKPESLGLSQMYRLPYKNTLMKAVLHSSELHGEGIKMDFPECIFGKIDNNKSSLRGRVQFEDAIGKNVSLDSMVTTILGNPKPSFYPNYIEQNPSNGDYTTLMDPDVRLRGWKRYPVRNTPNPLVPENEQKQQQQKFMESSQQENSSDKKQKNQDNLITKFTPLKKDSVFEGKIHFHNLKPEELGALLWTITWNNKKEFSHSIGMGKPYGFGQIKAEIKSLSFLENSTISNDYAEANTEKISTWQNEFSTYMESNINGWKNSPQLKELFAMADPKMANRPNWKLEYLSLADKEFTKVKGGHNNPKEYLAPYSSDGQNLQLAGVNNTSNNNFRNGGYNNNRNSSNNGRNNFQKTAYQPKSVGGVVQGSTYTCILLEEKTKKGGWKAKVKGHDEVSGSITNTGMIPADKSAGDEVKLKIRSLNGSSSSFDYVN